MKLSQVCSAGLPRSACEIYFSSISLLSPHLGGDRSEIQNKNGNRNVTELGERGHRERTREDSECKRRGIYAHPDTCSGCVGSIRPDWGDVGPGGHIRAQEGQWQTARRWQSGVKLSR